MADLTLPLIVGNLRSVSKFYLISYKFFYSKVGEIRGTYRWRGRNASAIRDLSFTRRLSKYTLFLLLIFSKY